MVLVFRVKKGSHIKSGKSMIHGHSLIERITGRIIAMDLEAQQEESQRLRSRRHTRNKVIVAVFTATFLGGIFLYAVDSLINDY